MKIKCAIVDDEHLARQYLRDYVSKVPFLELVGDFSSPLQVIDQINSRSIDLLFLDIQMPDITGLEFLKTLDKSPNIIITTAYKEYALEGFDLNVSDYLLKPFSFERFLKAVNKVSELIKNNSSGNVKTDNSESAVIHEDSIVIRADRQHYRINYDDIICIEGQKAYVTFHTKEKKVTALASLKDLEESLPEKLFIRVHKSFIVSKKQISSLSGNIIGIGDRKIPVGKNYRKQVEILFGISS